MSYQNPNSSFKCGAGVNPSVFVTLTDEWTVSQSVTGDGPIGVSQAGTKLFNSTTAGDSGDPIGVYGDGQDCWLTAGGTVTDGDQLKPDSSARGVTASSGDKVGAVALQSGTVNQLVRVRVRQGKA